MSKRTREATARIRLKKLLEENNLKSPDIPAAVVTANSQTDAYTMLGIYLDISNVEVPFEDWGLTADTWVGSLKSPVALYFLFKRKKDLGRFVRKMNREFPEKEVIL